VFFPNGAVGSRSPNVNPMSRTKQPGEDQLGRGRLSMGEVVLIVLTVVIAVETGLLLVLGVVQLLAGWTH